MKLWLKLTILFVGFFGLGFGGTVLTTHVASAYLRAEYYGYFYNTKGTVANAFYVLNDGLYSLGGSTDKGAFEGYILGKLNDGQERDLTGASYIIDTMDGGTYTGKPPSAAVIADWEQRISNPAISLQWASYSDNYNTGRFVASNGHQDVLWFVEPAGSAQNDWSLEFLNNGNISYVLKQLCANPLGGFGGLPTYTPTNFSLTPSISSNPANGSTVQPGTKVTLTTGIDNGGPTATKNDEQYQIVGFTVAPDGTYNGAGYGGSAPTSYWAGSSVLAGGSKSGLTFGVGNYTPSGYTQPSIPDTAAAGTKYCYAIGVQPATNQGSHSGQWRYATPVCLLVGKKPLVDVIGGDVRVGTATAGALATSTVYDATANRVYGSWGEYGLLATGKISGMASGAYDAYNGGQTGIVPGASSDSPDTQCSYDALTFANSSCAGTLGSYANAGNLQPISTVTAAFKISNTLPASGSLTLGSGTVPKQVISGNTTSTSTYTLPGNQTLNKGDWYVINVPNANVEIKNNITYNATANLSSLDDIPQLVIIAKNIYIDPGVKNVDSWLYASNDIFTCAVSGTATVSTSTSSVTTAKTGTGCGNQLTVHGPVSTAHLYMWRSPEDGKGFAGEVFDLRADSYLWAYNQSRESNSISTLTTDEKPPRF